jgi:hypothetical protein
MAAILSISLLLATSAYGQAAYPTNVPRQASALPLTEYHYTYPNVPYQVNPFPSGRGPQSGYNLCNSTTEGSNSQCQTAFVNSIDDFCLWGSPIPNGEIGNIEASVVAYCTKPGHGARVMPAGTLKSVQFMKTSAYVQVSGKFDQRGIGLTAADTGGELDPHGADLAGNPLGGLVFSNSLPASRGVITQGENWSCFVGSGLFCMKVCDNTIKEPDYCQNIYDLIGCAYNMPSDSYTRSDFTDCQGDLQLPPGVYVQNGQTTTWSQPASLSPGNTMPWQPSIPASSSCTTYTSAQLYSQQTGSVDGSTTASGPAATGTRVASSQQGTGARSTSASTSTSTSGAMSNGVPAGGLATILAALLALL